MGIACYLLYYPFTLIPSSGLSFTFMESLAGSQQPLNVVEILLVSALSVPVGLVVSAAINKRWLYTIARKLNVSNKFSDADVWSLVMNKDSSEWAVIRDLEHDLMYEGWVAAFSDTTDALDELLLVDTKVYRNSTAELLYEVPAIYLATQHGRKTVEFPAYRPTDTIRKRRTKGNGKAETAGRNRKEGGTE